MLVFDSSILIDNLRGGRALELIFKGIQSKERLLLPTVVLMEIYSGKSTRNKEITLRVKKLIDRFDLVDLDAKIAERAGILARETNFVIEPQDFIIAATALETGGMVVTLNKKHFSKVPNLLVYPL